MENETEAAFTDMMRARLVHLLGQMDGGERLVVASPCPAAVTLRIFALNAASEHMLAKAELIREDLQARGLESTALEWGQYFAMAGASAMVAAEVEAILEEQPAVADIPGIDAADIVDWMHTLRPEWQCLAWKMNNPEQAQESAERADATERAEHDTATTPVVHRRYEDETTFSAVPPTADEMAELSGEDATPLDKARAAGLGLRHG